MFFQYYNFPVVSYSVVTVWYLWFLILVTVQTAELAESTASR